MPEGLSGRYVVQGLDLCETEYGTGTIPELLAETERAGRNEKQLLHLWNQAGFIRETEETTRVI